MPSGCDFCQVGLGMSPIASRADKSDIAIGPNEAKGAGMGRIVRRDGGDELGEFLRESCHDLHWSQRGEALAPAPAGSRSGQRMPGLGPLAVWPFLAVSGLDG